MKIIDKINKFVTEFHWIKHRFQYWLFSNSRPLLPLIIISHLSSCCFKDYQHVLHSNIDLNFKLLWKKGFPIT